MNNKTIAIAVAGLLGVGAVFGAYNKGLIGVPYAEVVASTPVTVKEAIYGDVLEASPIVEALPFKREVCDDRVVQVRQPERYGDKDGMVAGAVVGGLLGNQLGKGDGKTLTTVAGAIGGGYVGREIDHGHVGGQVSQQTQRDCRTIADTRQTVTGYDVRYSVDGRIDHKRVSQNPGERLWLGERDKVIGYDVTWRYEDQTGTLRMDQKPGDRLPIEDGAIVVTTTKVRVDKG